MLSNGLNAVQASQTNADSLAIKAASGDLTNVADYTVAATQASLMTSLASTLRTKAVDAFNQIMGMQA
jgi:flagellar hook-basal body complex protein FliE